jgi:DNA-directed RNA polymerase specialized sigma24 family protein
MRSRTQARVRLWLRTTIKRLAVDRVRRPTEDVLDQQPFSLDEPWARGE